MTDSTYIPTLELATETLRPGAIYIENDPRTQYWIRHGVVFFHNKVVPYSDSTSFRFFISGFAADDRQCYYYTERRRSLAPMALKAYSFAYVGDEQSVRTHTAEVKGADVPTFRALDSGINAISGGGKPYILLPCGFAKDKNRVYFCDGGNAMPVVKADPGSFEVQADKYALDDRFVFWGRASLPKAKLATWRRLGGSFSTDGVRVYGGSKIIEGADAETFTVYADRFNERYYARDKHSYYYGLRTISQAEFEQWVPDV